jgi:hypothetical protein
LKSMSHFEACLVGTIMLTAKTLGVRAMCFAFCVTGNNDKFPNTKVQQQPLLRLSKWADITARLRSASGCIS